MILELAELAVKSKCERQWAVIRSTHSHVQFTVSLYKCLRTSIAEQITTYKRENTGFEVSSVR